MRGGNLGACVVASVLLTGGVLQAQAPTAQNVEVDPVTCWWRTSAVTVRIGETFPIVLTCSVLETDAVRAVVDRSRLGPAAVQFPPYEVVGGSQHPDHVTAGRRFMQYEYLLRLIAEGAFGLDVPVAGLAITYRIESRVEQDAAVQGREQSYELPPLTIRVASLVPESARSIREPAVPSLAAIAGRAFRARMFRTIALILFGLAVLTVAVAVARWFREGQSATGRATRHLLPNRTVLGAVRRELNAVEHETRSAGWSPEAVSRALTAARVVASYGSGRAVVQRIADGHVASGELLMVSGWPQRRRVAVSGSTTTDASTTAVRSDGLDIDSALTSLTAARYGRKPSLDASALDDALATVRRSADRVASRHTWLAETVDSLWEAAKGWRPRAWAR
jgi:hypothetical protein